MEIHTKHDKRYNGTGLTGLQNMGNTCFANSLMQCFSHTYELNYFLDNGDYKKLINKKAESLVLMEWDNLRQMMWSEDCIIQPGAFINAIRNVAKIKDKMLFTGYAQNDLTEFLVFMIDCFHTSIMRDVDMEIEGEPSSEKDELAVKCYTMMKTMYQNEYSEILDNFYGIHVSHIRSKESDYQKSKPEPFFLLSLPIPNIRRPSLYGCLNKYVEIEEIGGDNSYFVEETGNYESIQKQLLFWKLPNILVVVLKRFSNDGSKNCSMIDFPIKNLDLSNYVVGYNSKKYVYDLYGICNHIGHHGRSGHYTAFVKNAKGKWFLFDDENVDEVNENMIKTNNAYCFFFRKKNV